MTRSRPKHVLIPERGSALAFFRNMVEGDPIRFSVHYEGSEQLRSFKARCVSVVQTGNGLVMEVRTRGFTMPQGLVHGSGKHVLRFEDEQLCSFIPESMLPKR